MSYIALPGTLRFPTTMHGTITGPFYFDHSTGYVRYLFNNRPTIAHYSRMAPSLWVEGVELRPSLRYGYINSSTYTGGAYIIRRTQRWGYVLSFFDTTIPYEAWLPYNPYGDYSQGQYIGDVFFTIGSGSGIGGSIPIGESEIAYARGIRRGYVLDGISSETKTIDCKWKRWQTPSDDILYGKYSPLGDEQ